MIGGKMDTEGRATYKEVFDAFMKHIMPFFSASAKNVFLYQFWQEYCFYSKGDKKNNDAHSMALAGKIIGKTKSRIQAGHNELDKYNIVKKIGTKPVYTIKGFKEVNIYKIQPIESWIKYVNDTGIENDTDIENDTGIENDTDKDGE
jgi:hypothetical protein